MRELIKNGAYSFINGTREITVTDGRSFTAHDIRLIYNETQDVVICSSGSKSGVTVTGNVISFPSSLPALEIGNEITIEIDFPQNVATYTTNTKPLNFTSLQGNYNVVTAGVLVSITDATALLIRRIGTNMAVALTLPAIVNAGDIITVTVSSTGIKNAITQIESSADATISVGSLPAKIVTGCGNFAYYSPTKGKVLIGGLGVLSEDYEFINGDGDIGYNSSTYGANESTLNLKSIEFNGYLYYYSIERSSMVRLNLSNGIVTNLSLNRLPTQIFAFGQYIYMSGFVRGQSTPAICVIDTISLNVITTTYSNIGYIGGCTINSSGTFFFMYSTAFLAKYDGTSLTVGTVGSTINNQEFLCASGDYVYGVNFTTIRKYNSSDCNLVASITIPVQCYCIFSNAAGTKLYCITYAGVMYRIDIASFTRDSVSFSIGISSFLNSSIVFNGNTCYLFSGSGVGSSNAQTFTKFDMSTETLTIYSPANGNGLSLNTHNAMNIDTVNNRLIFYQVNRSSIAQTNCEIINIP